MGHVPDGVLRRLVDEPLAVPDGDREHVQRCRRCQAHRDAVADDARAARALLARPHAVPDVERAWARLDRSDDTPRRRVPRRVRPRPLAGATGVAALSGALVAGVAAAATLTVVFSPTHVAPVPFSEGDLQSLTSALGLGQTGLWKSESVPVSQATAVLPTSSTVSMPAGSGVQGSGTRTWAYGTIRWSTARKPVTAASLPAAEAAAGMAVTLPASLPTGVRGPSSFVALRPSTVTVTFDAKAGPALSGSSLTVSVGPGVLAEYGGATGVTVSLGNVPALAVAAMRRPTATSTGATTAQLESFVLGRPGFPRNLADEIRLLGNLQGVLPVPVPSGVTETTTSIGGAPAVVLSVGGTATGVIWEHGNVVQTVGGLLSQQDLLGVARQLG